MGPVGKFRVMGDPKVLVLICWVSIYMTGLDWRENGAVVILQFGKVKIVSVDAMKAYKGSGCLGSLILNPRY